MIQLLDLPPSRFLWIEEPAQFAHLTLPSEAIHSWSGYAPEFQAMCAHLAKNAQKLCAKQPTYSKIFLVYSKARGNAQLINEPLFEEFFSKQGFQMVSPETLPLSLQIYLVFHADEIAGTIGTATHLAMFARCKTKFYGLIRTREIVVFPQLLINQMAGLESYIVDVSFNFLPSLSEHGIKNIVFTDDFKNFAKFIWGENVLLFIQKLEKKINSDNYLRAYAKHYQSLELFYLNQLYAKDGFDFLNLLCVYFHQKELNRTDFIAPKLSFWVRFRHFWMQRLRLFVRFIFKKCLNESQFNEYKNCVRKNKILAKILGLKK